MSTRRSFALSFAQKYSEIAFRLIGTVTLARLLSPVEFGVFAVAAGFFAIGVTVARFGMDAYLIRSRDPAAAGPASAFTLLVASHSLVALLFIGTAVIAPPGLVDETLSELLLILAASLLLSPVSIQFAARLERDMRFGLLYVVRSVQVAVGVGVAIMLAALGFGPASLAASMVAEISCMSVAALFLSRRYPLPAIRIAGWRHALGFGATAALIDTLKRMGDSAPGLLLASVGGYGAAGIFSRAQTVATLFDRGVLQGISPVVLPLLSARRRAGQSLAPIYLKKVSYISVLAWPFFGFVMLYADPMILIVLGEQWTEAAPIVRLFALAGLLLPLVQMNRKFFVALGLQRLYLRVQVIDQAGKIALIVLLCLVDVRFVALAFLFENAIKAALTYRPLKLGLGHSRADLFHALRSSAWTTAIALAVPAAVFIRPVAGDPTIDMLLAALGAAVSWLAASVLLRHPIAHEIRTAAAQLARRFGTWPGRRQESSQTGS